MDAITIDKKQKRNSGCQNYLFFFHLRNPNNQHVIPIHSSKKITLATIFGEKDFISLIIPMTLRFVPLKFHYE